MEKVSLENNCIRASVHESRDSADEECALIDYAPAGVFAIRRVLISSDSYYWRLCLDHESEGWAVVEQARYWDAWREVERLRAEGEDVEPGIEKIRLSLDVDGRSYGEDETFGPAEIAEAGGVGRLIDDYIDFHLYRIIEIHGLDENEEIENPHQYVDVTEWLSED